MKTLVIGSREVCQLLPMKDCILVVRDVLEALTQERASMPLRSKVSQTGVEGVLAMMPAYLGDQRMLGLKAITVFPKNRDTPFESHQGAILLFEAENGRLLSVVDASSITAIRTAAASGLATDLLARKDSKSLAILGSGTQASTHIDAMLEVRKGIEKIAVWSRNIEHAKKFAEMESKRTGKEIEVRENAVDAVIDADIVCTTTAATSPVLKGEWLRPGTHINAVGASVPPFRELDSEAVVRSRFYTDRRESLLNESADFLVPLKEGVIQKSHLRGEVGELLLGRATGRTNPDDITLFKSLGLAVEDLAAANYVYSRAQSIGTGTWVDLNGDRQYHR
ncbi:MAG: ornithine cyclodeaminase family protein [Nitrososphaerales archaeon]